MEKYLKRLCNAILSGKFNDKTYRNGAMWNGHNIHTEPLFCSYGEIGFTVEVFHEGNHFCTIQWDWELKELKIDDEPYQRYINIVYLEDNDLKLIDDEEFECYTNAGEDMIITLEEFTKENLQEYIDNFDINENVLMWWQDGKQGKGVPSANVKEHYEDYEDYLKWLQKICDKMPY